MLLKRIGWFLTTGILSLILTACPGPGATKGILEVTVDAPSGVTPNVQVSGPGTTSALNTTGTTTLTEREPGDYTITVNKVLAGGIGYTGSGATVKVEAGKKTSYTVTYGASSGKIRLTIAGLPTGLDAEVNVKKPDNTNLNDTPINADTVLEDVPPGTYTLEAPNRTQGSSTYASAQNGATVTVVEGEEAVVNVAYTLNPGSATINVAGLDPAALPTSPVTVTLTQGSTSINRTFTANGAVNFANLAPGAYTITANAIANNGPQDYAFTLSQTTLNVASGSTASATLTYSKPTVTVNLTGLGATANANSVVALSGPASFAETRTLTGTARSTTVTVPRFGSYTANATSIVAGTTVDSFFINNPASSVTIAPSAATPTPSASLPMIDRGGTGQIWIAGNGAFLGANGVFTLADGASSLVSIPALSGTDSASDNRRVFRAAFDRDGNLYLSYQYQSSTLPAKIVRISAANVRAGNYSETATGNKVITAEAMPGDVSADVEPADMAFDANGNLWIANDIGNSIACISREQLQAPGNVTRANVLLAGTNTTYTPGIEYRGDFANLHAIAFDRNGNLWFTAGDFVFGTPTLTDYSRLSRIGTSQLPPCTGIPSSSPNFTRIRPEVRLDISLNTVGQPMLKPVALALDPSGDSLWVADYGGSFTKLRYTVTTSGTPPVTTVTSAPVPGGDAIFVDADVDRESIIRINLSGITPNPSSGPGSEALVVVPTTSTPGPGQVAALLDRITIPAGAGTNRGLQQPFGLAFDKNGRLWVAANNNLELSRLRTQDQATSTVTLTPSSGSPINIFTGGDCTPANTGDTTNGAFTSCYPSGEITDLSGKLYRLNISGSNPFPNVARNAVVEATFSAPAATGLVGVAFNIAPVNAPMYVRPSQ